MSRHEAAYAIVAALDLSDHGITDVATQLFRSLGADSPEVRPFIVLKWGDTSSVIKTMAEERLEVWAYDDVSYVRVDAILTKIRDAFIAAPAQLGDLTWNGYSPDLYDDIFNCATRNAVFTLPTGTN